MNNRYPFKPFSLIGNIIHSMANGLNYLIKNPVVGLYLIAQYQIAAAHGDVPRNGLVAEYLFNPNAVNHDSSGNSNNGVIYNGVSVTDRCDNANSAMEFDGTTYMQGSASKFPKEARSISAWINPAMHSYSPVIDRGISIFGYGGNTGSYQSMVVSLNNACMTPNTYSVQSHGLANLATWTDNSMFGSPVDWLHLAITMDEHDGTEFYINGVWKSSTPVFMKDTFVAGKDFVIGSCINPNGIGPYSDACVSNWLGMIDDFRIYDRRLSPGEVYNLSNEECPTPSNNFDWRLVYFPAIAAVVCLATGIIGTTVHHRRKKAREEKAHAQQGYIGALNNMIETIPSHAPVVDLQVEDIDKLGHPYQRMEDNSRARISPAIIELESKSSFQASNEDLKEPLLKSVKFGSSASESRPEILTENELCEEIEFKQPAVASSNPHALFNQNTSHISQPTQSSYPATAHRFAIQ